MPEPVAIYAVPEPGRPPLLRVSVELAEDPPEPVAVSPEALAAADTGPMPLTDTAAHAAAEAAGALPQRHPAAGTRAEARAEAAPDEKAASYDAWGRAYATDAEHIQALQRLIRAKDDYIVTLQNEGASLRALLHEAAGQCGPGCRTDAVAADRDALDAANGRLVERVRELELTLRSIGGALLHDQAHQALAAEANR